MSPFHAQGQYSLAEPSSDMNSGSENSVSMFTDQGSCCGFLEKLRLSLDITDIVSALAKDLKQCLFIGSSSVK